MKAKTIIRKAASLAIALPIAAYLYVEFIVLLPIGLAHYFFTRESIYYQSHKVFGIWWTVYTPSFCKYGFVFDDRLQDIAFNKANELWDE